MPAGAAEQWPHEPPPAPPEASPSGTASAIHVESRPTAVTYVPPAPAGPRGPDATTMVAARPQCLAWNPPRFRPAYGWVSQSSGDGGQALYDLRRWASTHEGAFVAYGATRGLVVGERTRELVAADPADVTGWVAVGVTALRDTWRAELSWLRAYCPVGTLAGGSVLVYRFGLPPDGSNGPDRPAPPCFDREWSSRG